MFCLPVWKSNKKVIVNEILTFYARSQENVLFSEWLNVIGLFFDIIGASFLSYGLIISKENAIKLGVPMHGSESAEDNLKLPGGFKFEVQHSTLS